MASNTFYSLHTHSKFSVQDALPEVKDIVARAAELEYPALALTDHGNVAGSVQHRDRPLVQPVAMSHLLFPPHVPLLLSSIPVASRRWFRAPITMHVESDWNTVKVRQ